MAHPAGESNGEALRLDLDRRLALQLITELRPRAIPSTA